MQMFRWLLLLAAPLLISPSQAFLTPIGGGGGSGDVSGPASSTDNAVARFDSTTGKIIQNSQSTISDAGVLTLTSNMGGTGTQTVLNFDSPGTINPAIRWNPAAGDLGLYFISGSTTVAHLQDNGQFIAGGFGTLNGLSIGDYYVRRGPGAGIEMGDTDFGVGVNTNGATNAFSDALFKVQSNLATNVTVLVKGISGQSANLMEFRDSSGTLLSYIDSTGLYVKVP